jgi:hypothetical protein
MSKTLIAVLGFLGVGILAVVVLLAMGISFHNSEVTLRNTINTKQTDNKNEMDAMWKNIAQTAQVAEKDRESLSAIFKEYATARTGTGDTKPIMNWIKEAVPNVQVNSDVFKTLMNIIVSQRDGFKFRQKELLDLGREHDNLITKFPGLVFASVLGRKHIELVIVTSTRTENAFKTGKDDDVNLFNTPAERK